MVIDKIALVLAIIGALNWGAIGLFGYLLGARHSLRQRPGGQAKQ